MSFTVSKMPTGRAYISDSGGFAGYRRAGQAICLCLQMAGAAATKGQQNVTRTRPYSAGTACLWRGEGTPRWNNTWALSLVCTNNNMPLIGIHVARYPAAGGLFQFSLPSQKTRGSIIHGNIRLRFPLGLSRHWDVLRAAFEVPPSTCPPFTHLQPPSCNPTWVNVYLEPPPDSSLESWRYRVFCPRTWLDGWMDSWLDGCVGGSPTWPF